MGETVSNEKAPKKDFIKGLKAEFNKIIWPDKETLTKQSIVVIVSTIALGIVIAVLDLIIKFGLNIVIG
jgi:preprotein translocase subunit SecE